MRRSQLNMTGISQSPAAAGGSRITGSAVAVRDAVPGEDLRAQELGQRHRAAHPQGSSTELLHRQRHVRAMTTALHTADVAVDRLEQLLHRRRELCGQVAAGRAGCSLQAISPKPTRSV